MFGSGGLIYLVTKSGDQVISIYLIRKRKTSFNYCALCKSRSCQRKLFVHILDHALTFLIGFTLKFLIFFITHITLSKCNCHYSEYSNDVRTDSNSPRESPCTVTNGIGKLTD